MITLGPSLTDLRGTQVTDSIIYTLVNISQELFKSRNLYSIIYSRKALAKESYNSRLGPIFLLFG
jgi:hypothetical protein